MRWFGYGGAAAAVGCVFGLSGCAEDVVQRLAFGESVTVSRIDGTVGIAVLRIEKGEGSDLDGLTGTLVPLADRTTTSMTGLTPYYVRFRITRTSAETNTGTKFSVLAGRKPLSQLTITDDPLAVFNQLPTQVSQAEVKCRAASSHEFGALGTGQSIEGCTPFLGKTGDAAPTTVQWVPYRDKVIASWE